MSKDLKEALEPAMKIPEEECSTLREQLVQRARGRPVPGGSLGSSAGAGGLQDRASVLTGPTQS